MESITTLQVLVETFQEHRGSLVVYTPQGHQHRTSASCPWPEIWDIESPRISAVILQKKMAAVGSKGKRSIVNYKDLNAISFVVFYDAARKSKGNFFEVDRLIEKRKVGHVSRT